MSKVSVIIPCYNQGQYVDESVNSVLNQTYQDFEIIIVNDGSTDELTIKKLQSYQKPQTRVLHTTNQGLAAARNNGIKISEGEYILPLDADDKIGKEYLEEAVKLLDANPKIGIVYCEAEYFGYKTGKWGLPPYSFPEILLSNMIFCTALFRKSDWETVGGYKITLKHGCEDWEFWLSLIELRREVYRIPKILFYYRVKKDSMSHVLATTEEYLTYSLEQIYLHHSNIYADNIPFLLKECIRLNKVLYDQEKQFRNLLTSRSCKIGRCITFPFQYFRNLWGKQDKTTDYNTLLKVIDKIRFRLQKAGIFAYLDHATLLSNSLYVSGWVISKKGQEGIDRVDVYLDGHFVGQAMYGLSRPDVKELYPLVKDSEECGFHFLTDVSNFLHQDINQHTILIKAIGVDGQCSTRVKSWVKDGC